MVQKSRRKVLKGIGGTFAGIGGISAIASEAKAASSHDIEVIEDGGAGTYYIVLPDSSATFSDRESSDDISRTSNTTRWSGELNPGDDCPYVCTESDNATFYGNRSGVEYRSLTGSIKVKLDGEIVRRS